MRFLIPKAEKGGMNSTAYTQVMRVLRENYSIESGEQSEMETYSQVCETIQAEASDMEKPGYLRAMIDPNYRLASWICIIMSICI